MWWEKEFSFIDISGHCVVQLSVCISYHCSATWLKSTNLKISDPPAALFSSSEIWVRFFRLGQLYTVAQCTRESLRVTNGCTDGKSMNQPTYLPNLNTDHSQPSFYFFAFGKKVLDGKNSNSTSNFIGHLNRSLSRLFRKRYRYSGWQLPTQHESYSITDLQQLLLHCNLIQVSITTSYINIQTINNISGCF